MLNARMHVYCLKVCARRSQLKFSLLAPLSVRPTLLKSFLFSLQEATDERTADAKFYLIKQHACLENEIAAGSLLASLAHSYLDSTSTERDPLWQIR